MRCAGKIVLVTGAQRGIEQAVALRFAQAGADVVLNFLDDQSAVEAGAAQMTALGRRCCTIAADISQPEEARRMPTGRLAEPEDIADVIVLLATDDARHIIGQLRHVSGGDYLA